MHRIVASLLIALVGVMALMPQALCPCAQRARAEAAAAPHGAQVPRACCERCLPRGRAAAQANDRGEPDAPLSCPCCEVNGKGKNLLQPGPSVGAPEQAPAGYLDARGPGAPVVHLARTRVAGDAVDDAPDVAPPAVTRAGVVLLI